MKRLATAAAVAIVAVTLVFGAGVAPPDRPDVSGLVPGLDLTSAEALGWTPAQHALALKYSRERWIMAFVDPMVGIASLCLIVFTGLGGFLARELGRRLHSRLAADALFVVMMVVVLAAMNFPLEILRFLRETRYGFASQGFADWMADEVKGLLVVCVAALLFLLPVWAAVRRWPRSWWVAGSAIGIVLSVIMIAVAPVFISPLFNTFTPLKDEALAAKILDLAHGQGIPAEEVLEVDASRQSRHDNAYVTGLLGTQRIVLYDTLLEAYTHDEIAFVMGHEMGHYVLGHIWRGVAVSSLAIVVGFLLAYRLLGRTTRALAPRIGFDSPGSIAAVPLALLILAVYLQVLQPVTSAVSRRFERQADAFAMDIVGRDPAARGVAVSAFQKMAARNLADPEPPALVEWWLYSHPSPGRRIRFAAGR